MSGSQTFEEDDHDLDESGRVQVFLRRPSSCAARTKPLIVPTILLSHRASARASSGSNGARARSWGSNVAEFAGSKSLRTNDSSVAAKDSPSLDGTSALRSPRKMRPAKAANSSSLPAILTLWVPGTGAPVLL